VIRRIIPLTRQTQLLRNIDVSLSIDLPALCKCAQIFISRRPRRTTERTSHRTTSLRRSPLIEARFVDVVPASSFAPHHRIAFFIALFEIFAADRAVFERFAVAVFGGVFAGG
jgi:hypothetical protein